MSTPVFAVLRDELDGSWLEAAFDNLEDALSYVDLMDYRSDVRIERCDPTPSATWTRGGTWKLEPQIKYMHYADGKYVGDVVRNTPCCAFIGAECMKCNEQTCMTCRKRIARRDRGERKTAVRWCVECDPNNVGRLGREP
jgi:hypothetical protein